MRRSRRPSHARGRHRGTALQRPTHKTRVAVRAACIRAIYPWLACYEEGVTPIPPFADILARSFRLRTVGAVPTVRQVAGQIWQ